MRPIISLFVLVCCFGYGCATTQPKSTVQQGDTSSRNISEFKGAFSTEVATSTASIPNSEAITALVAITEAPDNSKESLLACTEYGVSLLRESAKKAGADAVANLSFSQFKAEKGIRLVSTGTAVRYKTLAEPKGLPSSEVAKKYGKPVSTMRLGDLEAWQYGDRTFIFSSNNLLWDYEYVNSKLQGGVAASSPSKMKEPGKNVKGTKTASVIPATSVSDEPARQLLNDGHQAAVQTQNDIAGEKSVWQKYPNGEIEVGK